MNRRERRAEHLSRVEQVTNVAAGEAFASLAITIHLERAGVHAMPLVPHL